MLDRVEMLAIEVARFAAEMIRSRFDTDVATDYKGRGAADPVTEIDLMIEQHVRDRVRTEFPGHSVVGEEFPDLVGASEWTWVVDPVDGTRNFVLGIPLVACSIGVLQHGEPVAGAVALPLSDVLVAGHRGGGARWNGEPASTSDRRVDDGAIGVYAHDAYLDFEIDRSDPLWLGESRWFGSTAWELAMIAGGRLDHGVFPSTAVWDVAAGVLLVSEAGGRVLEPGSDGTWQPFVSFGADPSAVRGWSAPLVCGGPHTGLVADRLGRRSLPGG